MQLGLYHPSNQNPKKQPKTSNLKMPGPSKTPILNCGGYKIAAIVDPGYSHHLDHFIPLCSALKIDLLTTDPNLVERARLYPPCFRMLLFENDEALYSAIDEHIETVVTTTKFDGRKMEAVMQAIYQKEIRSLFLPHGFSKKGFVSQTMNPYLQYQHAFLYGPLMEKDLKEQNAFDHLQTTVPIGNLRGRFYKKHQAFFDQSVKEQFPSGWDFSKRTILYAPTWVDEENTSSIKEVYEWLFNHLNPYCNWIIKLHPFIERDQPSIAYSLEQQSLGKKNRWVFWDLPYVYPLFPYVDCLVADGSSLMFDFLETGKPIACLKAPHPSIRHLVEFTSFQSLASQSNLPPIDPRKKEYHRRLFPEISIEELQKNVWYNL